MNRFNVKGKIFYAGDYVNTDVMAPGRFDPIFEDEELAKIALIDYSPIERFVNPQTHRSDFCMIVAGRDFGCGSSRETAPMAISAAGVKVVVAQSFARIFYRNCINMGDIIPIVADHSFGAEIHGSIGQLDLSARSLILNGSSFDIPDMGVALEILQAGGLGNYTLQNVKV